MSWSRIAGTGGYLPERVVSNDELISSMDTTDEWIRERTGIRQRHIVADDESTCDLAERAALLGAPRHPYTEGLLRAIPSRVQPGEALYEIEGVVPPPGAWPPGCRFADRCPRVFERCRRELPKETPLGSGHWAACHAVERDVAGEGAP